jgi:arabinogalactan oligomer/maltooligosaccharide transport system permease protein
MKNKNNVKSTIGLVFLNIFFIFLCVVTLVPVLYAFSVSINAKNDFLSSNFSFWPKEFTLKHYKSIFLESNFLSWVKNSIFLAVATVLGGIAFSVPAAYAFSRRRFKGRSGILYILLMLNAFPTVLSMAAVYRLLRTMGLINTFTGLIFLYIGNMIVFGIWNMKGYFDTIPTNIEEAAKIDGADDFKIVLKIILPLAKPSIVVTATLILIYVWNEYLYVISFITGTSKYSLAAGLYSLQVNEYTRSWPAFSAASLLISLPILVVFFIIQKHMVSGLTAGSIK